MKNVIFFLLISSRVFAQVPSKEYIKYISTNYKHLRNAYIVIPVTNKIERYCVVTENNDLHDYYLNRSGLQNKMDYQIFLNQLFQNKITYDTREITKSYSCKVDGKLSIFKDYSTGGLNKIISKYLKPIAGDFRNKSNLDQQTIYGLIQIMFENGYLIGFSDYSGYYQFTKHFRKS